MNLQANAFLFSLKKVKWLFLMYFIIICIYIFNLYENKIKNLNNRRSTEIEHCKRCPAKLHCGGYCLGETVNETGKLDGQNSIKCAAVRKLYK